MDPALLERLTEQERAFLTMVANGFIDLRKNYGKPNGEASFRAVLADGGIRKKQVETRIER